MELQAEAKVTFFIKANQDEVGMLLYGLHLIKQHDPTYQFLDIESGIDSVWNDLKNQFVEFKNRYDLR